jgi:hypothetical protein
MSMTRFCYCAIGAGGKPCVDREYCDRSTDGPICDVPGCSQPGEIMFWDQFCPMHVCKDHKEEIQ